MKQFIIKVHIDLPVTCMCVGLHILNFQLRRHSNLKINLFPNFHLSISNKNNLF